MISRYVVKNVFYPHKKERERNKCELDRGGDKNFEVFFLCLVEIPMEYQRGDQVGSLTYRKKILKTDLSWEYIF